jgi:site-specific recombinase XerD
MTEQYEPSEFSGSPMERLKQSLIEDKGSLATYDSETDEPDFKPIESLFLKRPESRIAPEPVKRKPGRPKGSAGTALATHSLTQSDFFYIRAVMQNIPRTKAAARYLFGKPGFTLSAEYEDGLQRAIFGAVDELLDTAERNEANKKLDILGANTQVMSISASSLESFAQRFNQRWGEDFYSEAELQELYIEQYGEFSGAHRAENEAEGYTIDSKLAALNWLADRIGSVPKGSDLIHVWLSADLAQKLKPYGVINMKNLVDWVNLKGRNFHTLLDKFGPVRAKRLRVWLMDNELSIGVRLNRRARQDSVIFENNEPVTDVGAVSVQEFAITPLDRFAWPTALLGHNGTFRSVKSNTLGATNDKEVVCSWLNNLKETASEATHLSYSRSIERLVLWAIYEKRVPLSSLITADFLEFRDFLRNPPPHWCSTLPSIKGSPDWRPLRGPMSESSSQQTFSAISSFFAGLNSTGYLTANAIASVRTTVKREMQMDVMRSFSTQELAIIDKTIDEITDGPKQRRVRAIFMMLHTGGFRRSEAVGLTYKDLSLGRIDNSLSDVWIATFLGKGSKQRHVPIHPETYKALKAHLQDRIEMMGPANPVPGDKTHYPLAAFTAVTHENTPLLSVLDDRMAPGRPAHVGDSSASASVSANPYGALSTGRINSILKELFQTVAKREDLPDGHVNFEKASAHWLRHTFGHQALIASKGDLAAVQASMGHANSGTTAIYLKADLAARIAMVKALQTNFDTKKSSRE